MSHGFDNIIDVNWENVFIGNNFSIYKKPATEGGLFKFKSCGYLSGVLSKMFFTYYRDLEFFKELDPNCAEISVVEEKTPFDQIVYWRVKYPQFMSDRDYVFYKASRYYEDRDVYLIAQKSCTHSDVPENADYVRIEDYKQKVLMRDMRDDDGVLQVEVLIDYFEDPKLATIPYWVKNRIANSIVPEYLNRLADGARKYELKD